MTTSEQIIKKRNSVYDFYWKNVNIKSATDQFDYKIGKVNGDGKFACVYDGLLKKIT